MTLQTAKEKMGKIAVQLRTLHKVQSIEEVANTGLILAAVLNEMTLLYESLIVKLPDAKAKTKHVQALKEKECRAEGRTSADSKMEGFLEAYEDDLKASKLEAEVKVVARYMDALKENLNALSRLQRSLEGERIYSNKQT